MNQNELKKRKIEIQDDIKFSSVDEKFPKEYYRKESGWKAGERLEFQLMDIENVIDNALPEYPKIAAETPMPIVQLFGLTASGETVMVHVVDFPAYFYVPAPPNFRETDGAIFAAALNRVLVTRQGTSGPNG